MAKRAALCALACLLFFACAPSSPTLPEPDPGLDGLSLLDLGPLTLIPGTEIALAGSNFPSPGDGAISLLLSGNLQASFGGRRTFAVRLRAEYLSPTSARAFASGELFSALGTGEGTLDTHATVVVESAIDLSTHSSAPLKKTLKFTQVLAPRLASVELFPDAQATKVHSNDWVVVRGDNLLLSDGEGQTVAILDGCFLRDGATGPCTAAGGGTLVRGVELPVRPASPLDRRVGVFSYSPSIAGILPGRFSGSVTLINRQQSQQAGTRSDPRPFAVAQVAPELKSFTPNAASLGQYVELYGAGFVGGAPGQATLVRLLGQFMLAGSPIMIPVDLEMVIDWLPRFPDGPVGRYVLDETDALGQAVLARGGLRQAAGSFVGNANLILRNGKDSVASPPVAVTLELRHVKQLVLLRFLPSYVESLRLYGLRAVDKAVRARVLEVARRDYAGINIEFREAQADAPPSDFALYTVVEIGGSDPNGLGYLGYDNTPGRDMHNQRLYDRIGGVNAVTQNDGSPGYGGVFAEQLIGFSAHPGNVEKINVPPFDSALFDQIFDPLRPETGGTAATLAEAAAAPALSDGNICPVMVSDRPRQIACAIFVLGNLIGTTMTHELGHSLGLANPENEHGNYHNDGQLPGRIMNAGGLRSFGERSELQKSGPAVFCDTDFAYLQRILPLNSDGPAQAPRPPCLDTN